MKLNIRRFFVVFLLALFGFLIAVPAFASGQFTLPAQKPVDMDSYVFATCGSPKTELSLKSNLSFPVSVTGEIWVQPLGQAPVLLSSVIPVSQTTPGGAWNGPRGRIEALFPAFSGKVWGWVRMTALDGTVLGGDTLNEVPLTCGGANPAFYEFSNHVVAACVTQPDQVEVRLQNHLTTTAIITGQVWAKPDGGQDNLIAFVNDADKFFPHDWWGGPEERVQNKYPGGFSGLVWGFANITQNGIFVGGAFLGSVHLTCNVPTAVSLVSITATADTDQLIMWFAMVLGVVVLLYMLARAVHPYIYRR